MKNSASVAINVWLSHFVGSLQVLAFILVIPWILKSVHAAEFSCPSGDVTCLIAAINKTNRTPGADKIILEAGTYILPTADNDTDGANGLPSITGTLTITGEGAEKTIIERGSAASLFRLIHIARTGRLVLEELTLQGGNDVGQFGGGGIFNGGRLIILHAIITDNDGGCGNCAGAIRNHEDGILTISDSALVRNRGGLGGAIRNSFRGKTTITNSVLSENSAGGMGGAIFNLGELFITNSTLARNSVFPLAGGGAIDSSDGTVTLTNSTLVGNRARQGGGAFRNTVPTTATIINSTIANNLAGNVGGGIENDRGVLTIINSTVVGNRAEVEDRDVPLGGGGLYNGNGTVRLENTMLALNSVAGVGITGPDCNGFIISISNNLIEDATGCDITLQASDLTGNPGLDDFVNDGTPGSGHFPLNSGSQAIDAANSEACPETDQLGFPRVGICDIGAVEFRGPVLVAVDVRPRSDANKINPNSSKNINVAIFSGNGFDATTVDPNTVRFGATGTEAAPIHVGRRDVNGDGRRDMVVRFEIQDTGIKCGDTSAVLTGQISSEMAFIGSSPIQTVQCGK